MLQLVGVVGENRIVFVLDQHLHRIGRSKDNEIELSHRSVSNWHATIERDGGETRIRDLGSLNGTWVNDERITDARPIFAGDSLRFGAVYVRVERAPEPPRDRPWRRDAGTGAGAGAGAAPGPSAASPTHVSPPAHRAGHWTDTPADALSSAAAKSPEGPSSLPLLSDPAELEASQRMNWETVRRATSASPGRDHLLLEAVIEAGRFLTSNQTLEQLSESLLDLVARIVTARRILLVLRDAEGLSIRAARPPASQGERLLLSQSLVEEVLQKRESILVTDAQLDPRFREQDSIWVQNIRAALVAPLFDDQEVIGLIYVDNDNPRILFDQDQLRVLSLLANLIAVVISTSRLREEQRKKELMERELATAGRIQRSLLPQVLPRTEAYEMHALLRPTYQIGGDLYDVLQRPDGSIVFALGDVCGKGMGAALLMTNFMAMLRLLWDEDLGMDEMMARLHRQVYSPAHPGRFLTLFLARLDPASHRLAYVNAGHNPPLVLRPGAEAVELPATGMPVGLMPVSLYGSEEIQLDPGSLLCVYSDGITEAESEEDFFGEARLRRFLGERVTEPLEDLARAVFEEVDGFAGPGQPQADDMTLLCLRRLGHA